MKLLKSFKSGKLNVRIYDKCREMGDCAAKDVVETIKSLLEKQEQVNAIFAAAPSQLDMLDALTKAEGVDWGRVNAFHMDEYIGLDADAPQGFGNFLKSNLFSKLLFKSVQYIDSAPKNPEAECARYAQILKDNPADIVCMGIGENGHIAFNDPHVAFFDDPQLVKTVELDEKCRTQQVNDGCFEHLDEVPKKATTLTIPALINAKFIFCVVPGRLKRKAVFDTVRGEITTACPASILQTKPNATLYTDKESGWDILFRKSISASQRPHG
ncbi:MAG: glucosamine-6-phosphate deaminase [Clostridiales bacterium]|nr:glucosamine-6-phosphate deaminase [Clostridiales bacterium]